MKNKRKHEVATTIDARKLAVQRAGAIEGWVSKLERQEFIRGFVMGYKENKLQLLELKKLHDAILENKFFEVDRENKIIRIRG